MRYNPIHQFELSQDGGKTWEKLKLPPNCHPYRSCLLFGSYEEAGNMYRTARTVD